MLVPSDLHLQVSDSFGLCFVWQTHSLAPACSSNRRLAADFPMIPTYDGRPCFWLTFPIIKACSELSPYS
jgi:hypothetical protein